LNLHAGVVTLLFALTGSARAQTAQHMQKDAFKDDFLVGAQGNQ